ncbi:uncharacterized protein PFL1_05281 [Pseudozyma flocculosa PF-1]|uniref:Uncharacterized protein n=2 Tax=Pseudozyma flocculosa TaxID=84751 RepID=A0A5C3FCK1_9BASI|nr:uncharacterized protein PFL1_05281 [Pseudozyma flocculosa PF-1]EPQ26996.1 hypothetical protein PFL1_05281 [Pseudozyma flocculosa PF-1]SPO41990.1 uncharacterized protein PSFLO_07473 [Pseudozyma flocculosa]
MSTPSAAPDASECRYTVLPHVPGAAGNRIIGALYAIAAIVLVWRAIQSRKGWPWVLPIGAAASAAGFFIRPMMDPCDFSVGLYVGQQLVILVSPCAFLAFNYMLYKRLMLAVDPQLATAENRNVKSPYSFLPPLKVSRIFVWSDGITFFLQCSAGGLMAGKKPNMIDLGNKIFLVAVILMAVSYALFFSLAVVAHSRLGAEHSQSQRFHAVLRKLFLCLYFSSTFIMVRSIYRIAEFALGRDGVLASNEIYLFVLDALPLIFAISIWALFWPINMIDEIAQERYADVPMAQKPLSHGAYA